MSTLVTGAAGFIGFHVARALLGRGAEVVGLDNLNDYYDPALKRARLAQIAPERGLTFVVLDIADREAVFALFREHAIETVIHLAAQAGVRYSLTHPEAYIRSNVVGFQNVIDAAVEAKVRHFVYGSSSSVYGLNSALPFRVGQNVDHPTSLYAATKKANELVAHCASHLHGLPTTGLRFFTVYGPWGRPDMALFIFTRKILAGEPVPLFNEGRHARDFTYVDDVVEGVLRVAEQPAAPDPDWRAAAPNPGSSSAPWRVYNVGNGRPVALLEFLDEIERCLGRTAKRELLPMQPGDVERTHADITALQQAVGYRPATRVGEGVARFVDWYLHAYDAAGELQT